MYLTMVGHKTESNCAEQSKCLVKNTETRDQSPENATHKIVEKNEAKDLINVAAYMKNVFYGHRALSSIDILP